MARATLAAMESAASELTALTGQTYKFSPRGGGFFDLYYERPNPGGPPELVSVTNRKLGELIEFAEAYRRGYARCLDTQAAAPKGPPMPAATRQTPGTPPPGIRAFKGTFLVCLDQYELDDVAENEWAEAGKKVADVTTQELSDWLGRAVRVEVHDEQHPNTVGWSSVEMKFDTVTPLTPEELALYYGQ